MIGWNNFVSVLRCSGAPGTDGNPFDFDEGSDIESLRKSNLTLSTPVSYIVTRMLCTYYILRH